MRHFLLLLCLFPLMSFLFICTGCSGEPGTMTSTEAVETEDPSMQPQDSAVPTN